MEPFTLRPGISCKFYLFMGWFVVFLAFNSIIIGNFKLELPSGTEWTMLGFAVMKKREMPSYKAILSNFKQLKFFTNLERFHIDFEPSEIQAATEVFGTDSVFGCHFHFVRAVTRYIRKNAPTIFHLSIKEKNKGSKENGIKKWVYLNF